MGSDDKSFQDVSVFVSFIELPEERSSNEVESDDEGEQDLQEAFNELYQDSTEFVKANSRLKKENMKLIEKL